MSKNNSILLSTDLDALDRHHRGCLAAVDGNFLHVMPGPCTLRTRYEPNDFAHVMRLRIRRILNLERVNQLLMEERLRMMTERDKLQVPRLRGKWRSWGGWLYRGCLVCLWVPGRQAPEASIRYDDTWSANTCVPSNLSSDGTRTLWHPGLRLLK